MDGRRPTGGEPLVKLGLRRSSLTRGSVITDAGGGCAIAGQVRVDPEPDDVASGCSDVDAPTEPNEGDVRARTRAILAAKSGSRLDTNNAPIRMIVLGP